MASASDDGNIHVWEIGADSRYLCAYKGRHYTWVDAGWSNSDSDASTRNNIRARSTKRGRHIVVCDEEAVYVYKVPESESGRRVGMYLGQTDRHVPEPLASYRVHKEVEGIFFHEARVCVRCVGGQVCMYVCMCLWFGLCVCVCVCVVCMYVCCMYVFMT